MVRQARQALSGDRRPGGPFKQDAFTSPIHSERVGAVLGIALGVTFSVCFITGLLSDFAQNAPFWSWWPARPAGLFRVTQGIHVTTGIASIPLLLAKLWAVYPRFWKWPPLDSALQAFERLSLVPLVAGSLFLLFSGVANISLWYPWAFFFPTAHYWAAWVTMGAIVVHVGAKATIARRAIGGRGPDAHGAPGDGLSRRGFLGMAAAGAGLLTVTFAGQTFAPLRRLALFSPVQHAAGPQGFPVFKTAASAGVTESAVRPGYEFTVEGKVATPMSLTLEELRALPQREVELPIACVNGWSASVRWKGVRLADILERAGAPSDAAMEILSLQEGGLYSHSHVNAQQASDPATLLALEANGSELHIDHGYPVRLIGPNRPGVTNTKWVRGVEVL
jgi:hypothetical protein